jgi:hypothetical protein
VNVKSQVNVESQLESVIAVDDVCSAETIDCAAWPGFEWAVGSGWLPGAESAEGPVMYFSPKAALTCMISFGRTLNNLEGRGNLQNLLECAARLSRPVFCTSMLEASFEPSV